jgi:hypothetical protein
MTINRGTQSPSRHIQPSQHAHQLDKVIQDLEKLRTHVRNRIVGGMLAGTPTTGSTQATGAAGVTDWNVNIAAGLVTVGGVIQEFAAQADYDVHSGSVYTGLINGNSAIVALVAKNVAGTVSLALVKGTAAVTGSQVAPTDAEIQASVGAANSWIKIAELTINRTADTTVTQSEDNEKRPEIGSTVDTDFADWSTFA